MGKIMNKTYSIETTYQVTFTTRDAVPIATMVESLLAYEKLLKRTPKFIEKAYDGIEVLETHVLIQRVASGSLIQDFIIRYVVGGKENYNDIAELATQITDDSTAMQTIVALGVGAVIGYGAKLALTKSAPTTNIEAYNSTVINIGGDVSISADDVGEIIGGIRDKKRLAKETVEALSPAKEDPNSTIEVNDMAALTMSKELIAEVPAEYEPPQPPEMEKQYSNKQIQIHASDRDKQSAGWAGTVSGIVDKRVKFDLWEEVAPSQLHGKTSVQADITVTFKLKPNKAEYTPTKVEVRRVHLPENAAAQRVPQ